MTKRFFVYLTAIITITLTVQPLNAQDQVPAQGETGFSIFDVLCYKHPVKKTKDEKKWSMILGAGYIDKEGNTDSMDLNYSAAVKFDDNITTFKINYLGYYGETKDIKDENKGYAQLNFDHFLFSRVEFFSFVMYDYNAMIQMRQRNTSGVGFKFILIGNEYLLADLSAAYGYQYEKFKEQDKNDEWRFSVRARAELFPKSKKFTIRYYSYYIPEAGEKDNYRIINDVFLYTNIAGSVGIRAGYRRDFNTYTPEILAAKPRLKKTDEITYLQLSISI